MTSGKGFHRRSRRSAVAVAAVGCALAAFPAAAISSQSGDTPLSSRLTELAKPAVRSAPPARQAKVLSLAPEGPGSLLRAGNRVLVDVRFDSGAGASLDALRGAGAEIVNVSPRYQTVTAAATPASLNEIGRISGVQAVTENLAPLISSTGLPPLVSTVTPCFGAATSEGDLQLNAMKARTEFGVDGSGVTVGVLSDSYNLDPSVTTAAEDVASGDLPGPGNPCGHTTPVNVLEDLAPGSGEATDEGRAMAQIVHDLAPGASLAFATAFEGELSFAENIERLAKSGGGGAGAKVIVDDVSYFEEPFFQEGPVGVAVSKVTGQGVTYFSAAGNNNLIAGNHNIASWEAPAFRDAPACPAALGASAVSERCMDFKPDASADPTFGLTVSKGATLTVDMQWSEPRDGATADLDVFLLDAGGSPIEAGGFLVGSADDNIGVGHIPVEVFQWENNTGASQQVQLAVVRCFGVCNPGANPAAMPRLKIALLENGGGVTASEYPIGKEGDTVGPTIFGHNGGIDAMSVGAIRFNTTSEPEQFSSRGPVTHYFGPASGETPAAPIAAQTLHKPDIVATDGGADTFFGSCVSSAWRFFGTSAAAPHAAAVAALELNAKPSETVSEVKLAQTGKAHGVGLFPIDEVGAGLLDAAGALSQIVGSSPGGGTAGGPGFPPPVCPPAAKAVTPPAPVTPPPVGTAKTSPPPTTAFALHPRKVVRTRGKSAFVSFRFRSDQAGGFLCSVDRGSFRPCHRKFARFFKLGAHTVRVAALNSAGERDPTPAVFHFRVVQVH
jgi:hypothetical protein